MRGAALIRRPRMSIVPARPAVLAGILLVVVLAWRVGLFIADALWAISYPYALDYGEGIVWQQMRDIVAGRGYRPIDGLPDIVFHYPPIYHLVTAGAAGAGGFDQLATGRFISVASTFVSALFAALIAGRILPRGADPRRRWAFGGVAGLLSLASLPISSWAPLMRVDMLACALSLGGLWFAMLALKRPLLIHVAALLFVAALFTKQTMIATPASVFLVLLIRRPGLGAAGLATALGAGLVALAALAWATGGGFIRHAFLYNVNRASLDQLQTHAPMVGAHAILFMMAALGAWICLQRLRGSGSDAIRPEIGSGSALDAPERTSIQFVLAYFAITSVMLMMLAKVGSNVNYLIDWMYALAILAVVPLHAFAVRAYDERNGRPDDSRLAAAVVPIALAAQFLVFLALPADDDRTHTDLSGISGLIRAAEQPVISDEMVLLIRSGRDVIWEPAIFAELASVGRWDELPLVAQILQNEFAFFVTIGQRGSKIYDQRYTPAVADAIDRAYPRKEQVAGLVLHLPEDGAPPIGARFSAER